MSDAAPAAADGAFARSVLAGLAATPKTLEAKYFYDERGSELFDRICELEEYYPTRTELGLLERHAEEIADRVGPDAALIEFGSGASVKMRLLLDHLERPRAYVPIDISEDYLHGVAERLRDDYPELPILPVAADYTRPFELPAEALSGSRLGFFPGSTIGNFEPATATAFLHELARLLAGGSLLIGVDLKKDVERLLAAYDDAEGVTAEFNRNLLLRINRELAGTFDPDGFAHEARYNAARGRIEMHLVSRRPQTVEVCGETFDFAAAETIHTENSYKYTVDEFHKLAGEAGWRARAAWLDEDGLFSIHLLRATATDS